MTPSERREPHLTAFEGGNALSTFRVQALVEALQALDPRVVYVVPEEGTALWIDFLVVSAQSTRKAEAYALLDFLNRPEAAARNAQHVNFASPNTAADPLLPPAFRGNPAIYPPAAVMERAEFEQEIGRAHV